VKEAKFNPNHLINITYLYLYSNVFSNYQN